MPAMPSCSSRSAAWSPKSRSIETWSTRVLDPFDLAVDLERDQAFVVSARDPNELNPYPAFLRLELSTGEWTELYDDAGPQIPSHALVYDSANHRIVVLGRGDVIRGYSPVMAVDPETGVRSSIPWDGPRAGEDVRSAVVYSTGPGAGSPYQSWVIDVDPASGRIFRLHRHDVAALALSENETTRIPVGGLRSGRIEGATDLVRGDDGAFFVARRHLGLVVEVDGRTGSVTPIRQGSGGPTSLDALVSMRPGVLGGVSRDGLVRFDRGTGYTVVSTPLGLEPEVGSGAPWPAASSRSDLARLDETRVVVARREGSATSLLSIDIDSGLRSVLSGSDRGLGPGLSQPRAFTTEGSQNILVADAELDQLVRVSSMAGDRSVVPSEPLELHSASDVHVSGDRTFLALGGRVYELGFGFHEAKPGAPGLDDIWLDPTRDVLYGTSRSADSVHALDLKTGSMVRIHN